MKKPKFKVGQWVRVNNYERNKKDPRVGFVFKIEKIEEDPARSCNDFWYVFDRKTYSIGLLQKHLLYNPDLINNYTYSFLESELEPVKKKMYLKDIYKEI